MKAICIHDCQFRGVLVKADTVVDLTDAEAKSTIAHSSFRPIGVSRPVDDTADKPDRYGMTADDYRHALDTRGVAYHPTDSIDELRKLFDKATSDAPRKRSSR